MQSDMTPLGNAERAKSGAEPEGGAPFPPRWKGFRIGRGGLLVPAKDPDPRCCRRGAATAPVKVAEGKRQPQKG